MQESVLDLLERNIPGSVDKIKYCFLNKIYSREESQDVYEVVFSDEDFTTIQIYRTSNLTEVSDLPFAKDFGFDGDYMRCNPSVQVVAGDSLPEATIGIVTGWENKGTLFSFLKFGCDNNFVMLLDEVAESEDNWTGYGVAYFSAIKTSKSTMSVYLPITNKNGLLNKMLAIEDHSSLIMKPFYYGVPIDADASENLAGDFYARKTINGIIYNVYHVQSLPLFTEVGVPTSAPLINQAALLSECYLFVLRSMQDILKEYLVNEESTEWVGGSHQYTSTYAVEIKSELPSINKNERGHLLWACLRQVEPAFADDIRVRYLRAACKCLEYTEGEELPSLNSVYSVMQYIRHKNVIVSMYLISIRYYAYCSHHPIVPDGLPKYVGGGLLDGETHIKEGF